MPANPALRIKVGLGPTSSLRAFVASPTPQHLTSSSVMKFSFATALLTLTV